MADKKKRLIHYCDRCGHDNGLPIQAEKHVKSTCQLCNRVIGPLNETMEENHVPNDIILDPISIGSFIIEQMPGFLPGMNPANIHPTLPYKIQSQDLVFYFPSIKDDPKGRKTFIISNPKKGEEFCVILPGERTTNLVGQVNISD